MTDSNNSSNSSSNTSSTDNSSNTANSTETTDSNADANSGNPPAKAKIKAPTMRKIKVGSEEISLSDEDIARNYSKWKGADSKFREVSAKEKAVNDFFEALEKDPEKILNDKRLPLNKKALAEKWLVEQLEAELNPVDPRETDLQARERKLKEWEDARAKEAKDLADKEEAETKSQALNQRKAEISKTLSSAMESTQLSKDPASAAAVLREMALYMRAATERGETVTPDELVEHIHNSRFQQLYTLSHAMEGEELVEFLGEEIVNRIRKHDLARLKAGRGQTQTHRTSQPKQDESKPRVFIDPSEARMKNRGW